MCIRDRMPDQLIETEVEVDPMAELAGVYRYVGAGGTVKRCLLYTSSGKDSYKLHCRLLGVIPFKDVKVKNITAKEVFDYDSDLFKTYADSFKN